LGGFFSTRFAFDEFSAVSSSQPQWVTLFTVASPLAAKIWSPNWDGFFSARFPVVASRLVSWTARNTQIIEGQLNIQVAQISSSAIGLWLTPESTSTRSGQSINRSDWNPRLKSRVEELGGCCCRSERIPTIQPGTSFSVGRDRPVQ
jgi:hypothetical protein